MLKGQSLSQKSKIFDSSLYTREPWRSRASSTNSNSHEVTTPSHPPMVFRQVQAVVTNLQPAMPANYNSTVCHVRSICIFRNIIPKYYSHSLQSTFPGFLFPLGYGGLKQVLACKFVFFSVFPQFSKLWVSFWYHSLVSFRLKNRLGKSDYSFQKSDTWTRIH